MAKISIEIPDFIKAGNPYSIDVSSASVSYKFSESVPGHNKEFSIQFNEKNWENQLLEWVYDLI